MYEKTVEQLHEEDLQRIRGFRLMDYDFMTACFNDNIECTELILQIILEKPDLTVTEVTVQRTIKNLHGHSLRLDIDAVDSSNRRYDIEIQRADKGAQPKRARYHSSLMDGSLLDVGDDFGKLPESYIIFITENDVLKMSKPVYEIRRQIVGENILFDDGSHILYVNGENSSDTRLGDLMHDFRCTNPDEMRFSILAERARYFKEDPKGVASLCKQMEEMREEAKDRALVSAIRNLMMNLKLTADEAMNAMGIALKDRNKYISML